MINYLVLNNEEVLLRTEHQLLKIPKKKEFDFLYNDSLISKNKFCNKESDYLNKNFGFKLTDFERIDNLNSKGEDLFYFSIYNFDSIINKVNDNCNVIPLHINDDKIFIGPLYASREILLAYINRLISNNPMLKNEYNLSLNNISKEVLINKAYIQEKRIEIKKALDMLKKENNRNTIAVIQDKSITLHSFISYQSDIVNNSKDLLSAVDEYVGIVSSVKTESMKELGIDVYISVSTTCDYSLYDKNMFAQSNSGAGFTQEDAIYSCVGESIERLAAGYYKPDTILSCWSNLTKQAQNPSKFILFSQSQYKNNGFPYKEFNENTKVKWIESKNLTTKCIQYIPLSLVKLPYKISKDENRISPAISTGLALGQNKEKAILSGIYEVIERDAFSVSWLLKKAPNSELTINNYIQNFNKLCSSRYKCRAYDISLNNLLNTVLLTIFDTETNHFMIGAATRLTLEEAIKKAFLEASQGVTYVNMLVKNYSNQNLIENFEKIDSFQKHAAFYSIYPKMRSKVGYIVDPNYSFVARNDSKFHGCKTLNLSDKEKLELVINHLKEMGYEINYVNLTTPELENLNVHACKIVIPGLHQLHGAHKYRFLNKKRLIENGLKNESDINVYPHPFP